MLFDNFINYAMEQSGLTKYKLAKRLGVSQSTVANWMNGVTEPRDRRRAEIFDLFSVDEADLEDGFPKIIYKEPKKETPRPEAMATTQERRELHEIIEELSDTKVALLLEKARELKFF